MEKLTHALTAGLVIALSLTALPAFAAEGTVNVNEADASQLALLPRVGPALSARIIEYREETGKFKAPEDLMLVRGIGEKTFELMEPYVAVTGKTTLTEKVRGVRPKADADEADDGRDESTSDS